MRTDRDSYQADRLIITAGAWATKLLGDLGARLSVMRQVPMWFAPPDPRLFARDRFPIFLADTAGGTFYGIPAIDPRGLKVAQVLLRGEPGSPDRVTSSSPSARLVPPGYIFPADRKRRKEFGEMPRGACGTVASGT